LLLAAIVPIGALALYLAVGEPELPAEPLAERQIAPNSDPAKILAEVEHVRAGLKPVKEDLNNWVIVAEAYAKLGQPRDAAEAFRVAASIDPDNTQLKAALAENLIMADGGAVGQEAKTILAAIPADSPAKPEARFYLALADFQGGNIKGALAGWQSLLADSPADAGWIEPTRARIAEAAQSLGLDPAKETPAPRPPAARPAETPDAAAIEQMSPEEQREMIQNMVASLAAKLEANPDNPTGWRQLARAYRVLGEEDKAKEALDRATQAEAKAPAKP
jgi:cytochrome c-type biogenesis protein CcmH